MIIDNLIVIKGGAYSSIKKALRQWIDLYSKDLEEGLTFQIFKNGYGSHLIKADPKLDNERFYYLINYLNYPEGIEYKIDIQGFTIGKERNKLQGKNLLVYISSTDKEYDNVFVTTSENENFKVDFGGRITQTTEYKNFKFPNDLIFEFLEILIVEKKQNFIIETPNDHGTLEKRFKIICLIILLALGLTYLIFKNDDSFLKINYTIAFAIWGWLVFDYKMLQVDRLYFSSLVLGIFIYAYGYLLNKEFSDGNNISTALIGAKLPIFFLLIQRPLRFIFKKIMKREPKVDRPAPSFPDFIYMFIFLLITFILVYYVV